MPRDASTSTSRRSNRRVPQAIADVLHVNLKRLCKRTGLPRPRITEGQRLALQELFLTAFAEAVAWDDRMKMLDGVDSG